MKNQLKLALLFFNFSILFFGNANAQSNTLQYVDRNDLELFKKNGWELFYTADDFEVNQFDILTSGFVTATNSAESELKIMLFNASNLKIDEKTIKHSKPWLAHQPRFLEMNNKTLIAPFYKNQYYVDGDKGKIRKQSSRFLRDQSKYYKREYLIGDSKVLFFNNVKAKKNIVEFITLLKKDNLVDTLHIAVQKSKYLNYFDYTNEIEIIPVKNIIYILDTITDSIFIYNEEGKLLDSISLPYSAKLTKGLVSFKLELDQPTHKIYLFSIKEKNIFWQVEQKNEHSFYLSKKTIDKTNFYHMNVHKNHLYTIFYLTERDQYSIYRKKITD